MSSGWERFDDQKTTENVATLDETIETIQDTGMELTAGIDVATTVAELADYWNFFAKVVDPSGFDRQVSEIAAEEQSLVETEACTVCGCCQSIPLFDVEEMAYRVTVCNDCGLGQLNPWPAPEALARFYPPDYYGTSGAKFKPLVEAMVRIVGARHVRSLVRGLSKGSRVLDVGCGRGVLLSAFADRGYEAHGFEISSTAAAGADPRAEIRIGDDLTKAEYPDNFFDEVVLWHVLEHMPNPRETLTEIRRILSPGGRLVVAVPNFSSFQARWAGAAWFHLDLPRHLYHFPLKALRRLIEECGFDCQSERHFSLRQNPYGWVQSWLNKNRSLPRNGLYRMLKRSDISEDEMFNQATRFKMLAAYYLGMPIAVVLSVVSAMLHSGASVCVMAESRDH